MDVKHAFESLKGAGRVSPTLNFGVRPEDLYGIRVYIDNNLGKYSKQIKFPKTRKKRIRDKWRRKTENWRNYWIPKAYRVGDSFICNQVFLDGLKLSEDSRPKIY